MEKRSDNNTLIIGIIVVIVIVLLLSWTAIGATLNSLFYGDDMATSTATTTDNRWNMNPTTTNDRVENDSNNGEAGTTTPTTTASGDDNAVAFRIRVSDLPSEQQTMIRATGFDGEEIEITNAMKVCAEQSIGAERTAEIAGGARASASENIKLAACYTK